MVNNLVPPNTTISITVPPDEQETRIDMFLANHFSAYSRTYFKKLIDDKRITLNKIIVKKPSVTIKPDDIIVVQFPPEITRTLKPIDPDMDVAIVFEHPEFLIINKPPNLMVHAPTHTSPDVTLVDWLLTKFQDLESVGVHDRPGIVHRLDKDTSGLLIIPRNNRSHEIFSDMFKNRTIKKTYRAIVKGHPEKTGTIDLAIARDPIHRTKMRIDPSGRSATTHYKVLEYFDNAALVEVYPVTGRTHQIRVHLAAIGHPILGDIAYGIKSKMIKRHALHATGLDFDFEHEPFSIRQEPPQDFKMLLQKLKSESSI